MSDRDANHLVSELQEARAEIDRLRNVVKDFKLKADQLLKIDQDHRLRLIRLEELLRWRKWPEEKPEVSGVYLVLTGHHELDCEAIHFHDQIKWHIHGRPVLYWRPIGPLPGGG